MAEQDFGACQPLLSAGRWLEWGVISDPVPTVSPTPSPALAAFLRGIERRAFVFALAQSGQAASAQDAVAHAMRAFRPISALTPLSGWPAAFWSLLLAQSRLVEGEPPEPELRELGAGPRAAVLLRLVGGLDFPHAAQVLGVSEDTYRFALQRALHQLGEAGVSYASLGQLRERLHRQVKALPAHHVEALAELRGRVLRDEPDAHQAPLAPPRAWPRRLAWGLLLLLLIAFAATWWEPAQPLLPGAVQDLPVEATPATGADTAGRAEIIHPDYASLAREDEASLAADLALLAWLAAGQGQALPEAPEPPVPAPLPEPAARDAPEFASLPGPTRALLASLAAAWPGLDPRTRREVLGQAAHWQALSPAQREALSARLAEWDTLPAAERAVRRGHLAAWAALPAPEQATLRRTAARLALAGPEAQGAARTAFAGLPAAEQDAWWLGPVLGEWFSPLQPLFAYVPADQRPQLLAMLRELPADTRGELGELARRLPAAEREKLRRDLLAAPAAERAALVHERLAR